MVIVFSTLYSHPPPVPLTSALLSYYYSLILLPFPSPFPLPPFPFPLPPSPFPLPSFSFCLLPFSSPFPYPTTFILPYRYLMEQSVSTCSSSTLADSWAPAPRTTVMNLLSQDRSFFTTTSLEQPSLEF